jgi:FixJ family two-component response regulator
VQPWARAREKSLKNFGLVPLRWRRSDCVELDPCLVLDVRLPGQSGLDFQRELSDRNVALPIVFLTGHGDVPMSVRAMKAGAIEFLTKPFRDQDLLDARSKLPSIATGRRDKTPSCSTNCAGASIH